MTNHPALLELVNLISEKPVLDLTDDTAFEPLLALLYSDQLDTNRFIDDEYQIFIAEHLVLFGTSSLKPLLDYLNTIPVEFERSISRQRVAELIGDFGGDMAISGLLKFLQSHDETLRQSFVVQAVIRAIVKANDAKGIISLTEMLVSDSRDELRKFIAQALGNSRNSEAEFALILALDDTSNAVVNFAVSSLGKLKSPTALSFLIDAMNDFRQLSDSSIAIAQIAIEAVHAYQTDKTRQIVFEWSVANLKHANPEIRYFAAHKLGTLGNNKSIPHLYETLNDNDSYEKRLKKFPVSDAAKEALITIGTPEALAALEAWQQKQSSNP